MNAPFTPSHRLLADRDYYRRRAEFTAGIPVAPMCKDQAQGMFVAARPADHDACDNPACGCACHAPTDSERALFRRLADEIDSYLITPAQDGLFAP